MFLVVLMAVVLYDLGSFTLGHGPTVLHHSRQAQHGIHHPLEGHNALHTQQLGLQACVYRVLGPDFISSHSGYT